MVVHDPKNIGRIYENIPTWNNGAWELTSFESREEFANVLEKDYFKEPGTYELDDIVNVFKEQAIKFKQQGYYCEYLEGTLDFEDYWDWEKLKSRKGVFYFKGDKKFYLPREYYFWINFLEIVDKVKKQRRFNDIWDTQIWMSLYEFIAELKYKHAVVLKKRQFGSSLYHVAKLINILWFEDSPVLKMGASLEAYLTGVNGSWKFAQMYRTFLNKNTAWTREMNPGIVGEWIQKQEVNENGRKYDVGLMGTLQSMSFQQSDTAGVGGLTTMFFYEEAGIAPRMDKTFEFLLPAMEAGDITTGFFAAAGTVGDLDQCKPLKTYMYKANANGFYAIPNKWVNNQGAVIETGLFIPEQYSMPPFIDEYGNSLVEEATTRLKELYDEWDRDLEPGIAQLRKSQRPMNMEIAFAARTESRFPLALVEHQKLKIFDGEYPYETVELFETPENKVDFKLTKKPPIREFPVDKKMEDKSGSIVVFERPDENSKWMTYFASVDPVSEGKTSNSDSLCTIYVYKNIVEVTRDKGGAKETYSEGDKIVCAWAGRYDDINDTHKRLELIIRWYNAWTLVEANVSLFILYMIQNKLQKYLVPKSQMIFLKELGFNKSTHQEYGWKNTGVLFSQNLLPYLIEFLKEKIYEETDKNGEVISTTYGISRIPDHMALEEMSQYQHGLNVDRLISLAALIAFVKLQYANRGVLRKAENDNLDYLDNSDKIYKLDKGTPFKNLGKNKNLGRSAKNRNPFRRIR